MLPCQCCTKLQGEQHKRKRSHVILNEDPSSAFFFPLHFFIFLFFYSFFFIFLHRSSALFFPPLARRLESLFIFISFGLVCRLAARHRDYRVPGTHLGNSGGPLLLVLAEKMRTILGRSNHSSLSLSVVSIFFFFSTLFLFFLFHRIILSVCFYRLLLIYHISFFSLPSSLVRGRRLVVIDSYSGTREKARS